MIPSSIAIVEGEVSTLKVTDNGLETTADSWTTTNASKVDVLNGDILGVATTTQATITATLDGNTSTCKVKVTENTAATGTRFTTLTTSLAVAGTSTVEFKSDGTAVANNTLTFATSNADIATISATGIITAIAVGKALITTEHNNKKYGVIVIVNAS